MDDAIGLSAFLKVLLKEVRSQKIACTWMEGRSLLSIPESSFEKESYKILSPSPNHFSFLFCNVVSLYLCVFITDILDLNFHKSPAETSTVLPN